LRKEVVKRDLKYIRKKEYIKVKPELHSTIYKSIQSLEKQIEIKKKEYDMIHFQNK